MKRLMTTTAIALMLGSSAMAEGHMASFADTTYDASINLYASDLLGARVYASENEMDASMSVTADATTEWDDIGEINEILLNRDGEVEAVIVGVGGFLGIGEKDVAVDMNSIKFVSDGENPDDYFLVINSNVSGLEEAPAYERAGLAMHEAANKMNESADLIAKETDNATEEVEEATDQVASEADEAVETVDENVEQTAEQANESVDHLMAPTIERDGYKMAMTDDLNTEDLTGARVYGINDEDVGEISELLLTDDGKLDRAVVDVGGFLGLGEHPVAVSLDELTIMRSDETGDFRVYIDSSEERLEAQPAYEG